MKNDLEIRPAIEIGVEIHDETHRLKPDCTTNDTPLESINVSGRQRDCPRRFRDFLRDKLVPKGSNQTMIQLKKEEALAYKELLVSLESIPKEQSWAVVKVTVNAVMLAVFVAVLVTATSIHEVNSERVLHLRIHRWVALLMVVVSGLPCIRFVTLVVSEPMVWFWKTHKYVMYMARSIKRSVDVTLWFLLVLAVWYTWFRPNIVKDTRGAKTLGIPVPQYEEALKMTVKQLTRMLMALTLGAFLWTLKVALYLRLNANLHYKELCPMIRRTILDYHAIQFIARRGEMESWSFIRDDGDDLETKIFWMDVSNLRIGSAPIWILSQLCSKYMDHMKRKKPEILSELDSTNDDDDKFMERAKKLYQKFLSIRRDQKIDLITLRDIEIYGLERNELDFVFKLFCSKDQPQITEDEFLRWAVKALKGCLRLERIIASSRRIFVKLNMLMSSCVLILVVIIWLLISEIVTTAQLAILFAPLVSASFVFGESLKRTFDGLIFVFGMHPFDVDQRVIVDNIKMRVNELRLLTTVFFVYETGDEMIYPNSVLATKSIIKLDLTKNMPDSVEFTIPVDTPNELISDLGVKIKKSLDDELAFTSDTLIAKKEISETNITLLVYFKYLVAYSSAEIKARYRSKILETVVKFREEMKQVMGMEKDVESKKDEYEADATMEFQINGRKMKLWQIEELKNNIMEILQGCGSSKDCSKVLLKGIGEEKITISVHIRYRKDLLKPGVKEDLKQKIQRLIDHEKVRIKENQSK
ncbi:hypothetical protein V2J09_005309 [Rumex salicifolius]